MIDWGYIRSEQVVVSLYSKTSLLPTQSLIGPAKKINFGVGQLLESRAELFCWIERSIFNSNEIHVIDWGDIRIELFYRHISELSFTKASCGRM